MKKYSLFFLLFLLVLPAFAQNEAYRDFQKDITLSGMNFVAYRAPENPQYTAAPKGYKPFYISHYARHGSRWLIHEDQYASPRRKLHRADTLGVLTPLGREVMSVCDTLYAMSRGRLGELTDVGAEQHRGIAGRMAQNWKEVFDNQCFVEARSTPVVRCILSMMNELWTLKMYHPGIDMRTDASEHDMYYLNDGRHPAHKMRTGEAWHKAQKDLKDFYAPQLKKIDEKLAKALFTDVKKAEKVLKISDLREQLFRLASNMQSHHFKFDLFRLFTVDEAYVMWALNNYMWYANYGFSPLTQNKLPLTQENLLKDFIQAADSCVNLPHPSATLRFGHEVCVLPLACLMGLDGADYATTDPFTLADHWRDYRIFTMASNIQLVFFRHTKNPDKPVLVKALLNEREVKMPIEEYQPGFYEWNRVREHWVKLTQNAQNLRRNF